MNPGKKRTRILRLVFQGVLRCCRLVDEDWGYRQQGDCLSAQPLGDSRTRCAVDRWFSWPLMPVSFDPSIRHSSVVLLFLLCQHSHTPLSLLFYFLPPLSQFAFNSYNLINRSHTPSCLCFLLFQPQSPYWVTYSFRGSSRQSSTQPPHCGCSISSHSFPSVAL